MLIQDFHFALLPQYVRQRIPKATIALFWHVPWPNSETFGVCPWKRDILMHMLHADILGFHTQYHCQNFLATADRFIECQISHEHMTVTLQGHVCHVAPYPISIEWPPRWLAQAPSIAAAREEVRRAYGIDESAHLVLGVERWDFTKGILERFQALERFFEQRPAARGHVTLLQIAAPSRSELPAYRALQRAHAGGGCAHQRALRERRVAADRAGRRAPGAGSGVQPVPRRGYLPRQQPA